MAITFGVVLIVSAYLASRPRHPHQRQEQPDRLASRLRLDGNYPGVDRLIAYHVRGVPGGFGLMFVAGGLSGLLGIGSGALKVLAMDQVMRIPFKVSTTTSNFMIGVTAAASAGVYLNRGYVDPGLAMPVILGVLPGALLGTRFLAGASTNVLRWIFAIVILFLAAEMIYGGLTGRCNMAQHSFSDRRHGDPAQASEERLEIVVGNLLRAGVIISAAVVLLGGVIFVVRMASRFPTTRSPRASRPTCVPLRELSATCCWAAAACDPARRVVADCHAGDAGCAVVDRLCLAARPALRRGEFHRSAGPSLQPFRRPTVSVAGGPFAGVG